MPIEQHPIPQDVAGYKFRLIGDMTVKQFIWLASGIILGLIAYSLPLPFFFKYPLTGLFVGLGAGIAFLPIEGRPMDKWLIAFIKSVYSPTQYTWKKSTTDQAVIQLSPTITKTTPPIKVTTQTTTAVMPPKIVTTPVVPQTTPTPTPQTKSREVGSSFVGPNLVPPNNPQISQPKADPPLAENIKSQISNPPVGNLPIPFTPTTPNTLVGMTLTPDGKIMPSCLIEIKGNGISVRATKSNQLGQFLFAKPLENGTYQIFTEKPSFTFDSYSLVLTGQIIKPLRLQAKAND